MTPQLLIDAVVQQTTVFIAQLATAGGVRAPLANVANQVFLDLSEELQHQGVTKKVIADMFGMALRTYHRRVHALRESRTDVGRTLWEAILEHVRDHEPISGARICERFVDDDIELVSGVLNDLVGSGLAYRSGRGDQAVYRAASEADFAALGSERNESIDHLVWLAVYRHGPVTLKQVSEHARLGEDACASALTRLTQQERVTQAPGDAGPIYSAPRFEVPLGEARGWEAAVLDHFQALVTAVSTKLGGGASHSRAADVVGGSTWSLDVWPGHPLEDEAMHTLAEVRERVEDLRRRIDEHNAAATHDGGTEKVVFYAGQYVREQD